MKAIDGSSPETGDWAGESTCPGNIFTTPLDEARSGRLVFASGVVGVVLGASAPPPLLLQVGFARHAPHISLDGGVVTVRTGRLPSRDQFAGWQRPAATFLLNSTIPWEIEFLSSLAHLRADLSPLQLRSLDILGGATRLQLRLGKSRETAFIYMAGGVSQSSIVLPPGTGIGVQVSGGIDRLLFDGQRFRTMSAETRVQSPGYERATSRYDVCIAGGASRLTIGRER